MKMYNARLDALREQDVNARILPLDEYNTLANNIKKRGRLESVPYCALVDGRLEIISGHHRIKAARSIGMTHAPVLVDESGLSRSEIVAKQLAHNRLAGFDDPQTLRILFDLLDNPLLMLESGLSAEMMSDPPKVDWESSMTPRIQFDWKNITFTFLPHQLREFEVLMDSIPPSDFLGVAGNEMFTPFVDAAQRYGRLKTIRSIGLIISRLTQVALAELALAEADEKASDTEVSEGVNANADEA